jgi:septum formation protein
VLEEFEIVVSDVPEHVLPGEHPRDTAERLASSKARAVAAARPSALVIGADTVVALPNGSGWTQFAKPEGASEACAMLRSLSGARHSVITGVAVISPFGEWVGSAETRVTFRDLLDAEIERYVETGEPMDKAGAYAIQGGAASFVAGVDGSISNVVGLPMELLSDYMLSLKENGAAPI